MIYLHYNTNLQNVKCFFKNNLKKIRLKCSCISKIKRFSRQITVIMEDLGLAKEETISISVRMAVMRDVFLSAIGRTGKSAINQFMREH